MALHFTSAGDYAGSDQCLGAPGHDERGSCPSTEGFPTDVIFTVGPMPAAGVMISNLYVAIDEAATGDGNTVSVLDNGKPVLACTVASKETSCTNTAGMSVPAGHYLQVHVTVNDGAEKRRYRVSVQQ